MSDIDDDPDIPDSAALKEAAQSMRALVDGLFMTALNVGKVERLAA